MAAERKKAPRKPRAKAAELHRHAYPDGENPVDVYLDGLGEDSSRVMGSALESLADILSRGRLPARELPWHALRPEHVSALRGRLQKLYAPATANRYLTALRAVLKACWRLELVDHEAMAKVLDVAPVKGERPARGRAVVADELRAVFRGCAEDANAAAGARDAAMLAVLYGGGLRRAEVALLDLADYDAETGALQVHGKGNKARQVFLPSGTRRALARWLEHRLQDEGALFCHVGKTGTVRLRRITAQLVYRVVGKRLELAGVEEFTPHDLRRSHISDLLDEGVDLATVARHVGHRNVQTTARYDRRTERALKDATKQVRVPIE